MPEQFNGKVEIQNGSNDTTIDLDGNSGDATFKTTSGDTTVLVDGSQGDIKGYRKFGTANREMFRLDNSSASLYLGATDQAGDIFLRDASNNSSVYLYGSNASLYLGRSGNAGDLYIRDGNGSSNSITVNGSNAAVYIGRSGNEGDLRIRDNNGRDVFIFDGNSAALYIGGQDNEGDIVVRDAAARDVMHMNAQYAALYVGAAGNEGDVIVRDNNGNDSIHLDGGSGDIILRNADAAEHFDIADLDKTEPGMAMVLNQDGKLEPCTQSYDTRSVGIVAGAGDYRPGIVLDKKDDNAGRLPISLMGKVSCKADATSAPIAVGDLLTTSPNTGHVMKATDLSKALGAILGKALTPLAEGTGNVNLLVMQR